MSEIRCIDGTPVWNVLERNQRIHARSALDSLRACLDQYELTHSPLFKQKKVLFENPHDAIRDACLSIDDSKVCFNVTHGKHKLFHITVTDLFSKPPKTVTQLRNLVDGWECNIKTSTSGLARSAFLADDKSIIYPAVAAAYLYRSDWDMITLRFGRGLDDAWLHLMMPDRKCYRIIVKDYGSNFAGLITPSLFKALSVVRPYVALYGEDRHKSWAYAEIGQRKEISAKNNLDPVAILRAVAEAEKHGWRLFSL